MNSLAFVQEIGARSESKAQPPDQHLGKEDFLNLLVTQLKNQDPLNPSDPTEFTAQLAQYSSLEQLYNINERMKDFGALRQDFSRLSALELIGKHVVVQTASFRFEGEPVEMGFRFSEPVEAATVYIKGENGQILDEQPISLPSKDEHFFTWDGTDPDGEVLPEQSYSVEVIGTTAEGTELQGTPMVATRISGVDFSAAEPVLLTDSGEAISLLEVVRVNNLTQAAGAGI